MAVIRLELEVDSEVYPELHAALERVGNSAMRSERLRQLAATGLVWETVRLREAWPLGAPVAPNPEPLPHATSRDRAGNSGAGRTADRRTPNSSSDFIDLALNAAPTAADAGSDARGHAILPRHIPMLFDVVNPPPGLPAPAARPFAHDICHPSDAAREDASASNPGALPEHKTVVRSRLLRMKGMGLFKNG